MVVDVLEQGGGDPTSTALLNEDRVWSYDELDAAVDERAEALLAGGHRGGRIVPLVLEADAEGVITLLALWRVGATAAPLNPRLTEPEQESARRVLAEASAEVSAQAQVVLWTSGTAGRPRGVALSFEGLAASARASAERLDLGARDVWLASLSPAHVGGLALITRSVLLGGCLVGVGPFEAGRTSALLEGRGLPEGVDAALTHVSLVPTQLLRLLDVRGPEPPPETFRCALVGGARAPADLVARALECGWPVALTYGLTEATSQVATAPPALARSKPGTVGRPLAGVDVRIGGDGEIQVRGATLAVAYVGARSEALSDAEGWHHTGDLGRFDEDGDLWITGRCSDRIVTGGVTVDAVEVEEALRSHEGVVDACVVGLPDVEWGERVGAWVVPAETVLDLQQLDAWLRRRLSPPKLPRAYHVERGLPLNPNGKVDRGAVLSALKADG